MEYINEEWRDIPGFENLHQASSLGRIRSVAYIDRNGGYRKERILSQQKRLKYWRIKLTKDGIEKNYTVSRLVWSAFNGDIPEGMDVNHIDENTDNNSIDNLNLMTRKENINWGTAIERRRKTMKGLKKGIFNTKCSKPVEQYDLEGNFIKLWPSAAEVERQLGFKQGNITICCQGKIKRVNKYVFKYANMEELKDEN